MGFRPYQFKTSRKRDSRIHTLLIQRIRKGPLRQKELKSSKIYVLLGDMVALRLFQRNNHTAIPVINL